MTPEREAISPTGTPVRPAAVPVRSIRVCAVTPCYNRPDDVVALLGDLEALSLASRFGMIDLSVVVVDNASATPIADLPIPPDLDVRIIREPTNRGGSGGYNAGLRAALRDTPRPDYAWVIDSDARVEPGALAALVDVLESDHSIVAAGSMLRDTITGRVYEIGARIDPRTGRLDAASRDPEAGLVECDYAAACSCLVRADAAEQAGLMPDVFLNGDDVGWGIALRRATGGRIVGVPWSVAHHPAPDRMRTWARYYIARNAIGIVDAAGLGPRVRFTRAMREVARALQQSMMHRPDLADLHLRGLRDALEGRTLGPAPQGAIRFEPPRPMSELAEALKRECPTRPRKLEILACDELDDADAPPVREAIRALGHPAPGDERLRVPIHRPVSDALAEALARMLRRPAAGVAFVPARGRPESWFRGRVQAQLVAGGFNIRRTDRLSALTDAWRVAWKGLGLSVLLALRPRTPQRVAPARALPANPTLGIVVVSFNRRDALLQTLTELRRHDDTRGARIVVVDNASSDGSPDAVRGIDPDVRLIELDENVGVEAFNVGVRAAGTDVVLVLDDDARPDTNAVARAMAILTSADDIAAVPLLPVHPAGGRSEWPFAPRAGVHEPWPVMGCANLVRSDAWRLVGGYERRYFLYRNDTDLALKLVESGWRVAFDPSLVAWHDSPATGRKPDRWFRLATRNWVWLCRRHGRGVRRWLAILSAAVWAIRLTGLRPASLAAVCKGLAEGVSQPAPPRPATHQRTGSGLRAMLRLRSRRVLGAQRQE